MNRLRIILAHNHTLHEMMIGIVISNVVLFLIATLFAGDKKGAIIGVAIGTLVALIYNVHMAVTLDDALCLDEKGAMAQVRKHMLIRYVFVCAVVGMTCAYGVGNPVFIVISCLTVKLGAYMQPVIHKIIYRSTMSEDTSYEAKTVSGSENGGKISE